MVGQAYAVCLCYKLPHFAFSILFPKFAKFDYYFQVNIQAVSS